MAGALPNQKPTRRAVGITTNTVLEEPSSFHNDMSTPNDTPGNTLAAAFAQFEVRSKADIPPPVVQKHSARFHELQCKRQQLPIWQFKQGFLQLLKDNQVLIVEGETGCGKTTQIPQWSLEFTRRKRAVVCTQPRRVAASSIAKRVAAEMDVEVGEDVGYHIRFDKCTSTKTVLTYMTEGVLLRLIASNARLEGYGVILLDECHERGIFADVLMGLLLEIVTLRKDLRVVIMSATIDTQKVLKYFHNPPFMNVPGHLHDVEIKHAFNDQEDYVRMAVTKVKNIHKMRRRGDILIFVPGLEDIERICGQLECWMESSDYNLDNLYILPFYSRQQKEEQDLVFKPIPPNNSNGFSRKVIVATNIAETSLTIDGVVFVIDSGYMNLQAYDWKTKVEYVVKARTTQTNAKQRAGRVGRTQPGTCFRLYTEETFEKMKPHIEAEVLRSNLSAIVLNLIDMGQDPLRFNFMDAPEPEFIKAAAKELRHLQALDKNGITELGKRMAEFPLDPKVAKVLIKSSTFKCQEEILTIAAMLTVPSCFIWNRKWQTEINGARKQFISPHGDHIMLLNIYNAYLANGESEGWCNEYFFHHRYLRSAVGIRSQLMANLQRLGFYVRNHTMRDDSEYTKTRKALLSGFCLQIAQQRDPGYRPFFEPGTAVEFHGSTGLTEKPDFVFYHERYTTSKNFIRIVTPFDPNWWSDVVGVPPEELLEDVEDSNIAK